MNIFSQIGAWFMLPFVAFSAWFGLHTGVPMQPAPAPIYTPSPVPTSTPSQPAPAPAPQPASTTVSLYSISSAAGAVGDEISITGFGFTSDNTILMGGTVAARNVLISSSRAITCTTSSTCHGGINQTLTFTIPSSLSPDCKPTQACPMYMRLTTPGVYAISVENENGVSNTLTFTVTGTVQL